MKDKYIVLISSCQKYDDLWYPHIDLMNKNWKDRKGKSYIVSDGNNNRLSFSETEVFALGNKEVPKRIKIFLELVDSEYVLLTLDDYFLTKPIYEKEINDAISFMECNDIDYLRLYKHPIEHRVVKENKNYKWIKYNDNYKVNLYPGIWKRDFLLYTLRNDINIWKYEASLTKSAIEYGAKSAVCRKDIFPFLDVMRQGFILHKAYRFCKKNNYVLKHSLIPWKREIKRNIKFYAKEIFPVFVSKLAKRIMIKFGHEYYSEINVEDN